ncbi:hypothetical protein RhiirB3_497393 [Rhizophagus irregularis]|nr:hypothetical protein RhiirB3_497393 [Rhizophagus irregularis]
MAHLTKYTNKIDLKQVNKCNINGKSFLEILSIALQKVELTRPTAIQGYIKRILPTEEYNNTETFIKDHKPVLKELGVKNEVQLTYLLFTLTAIANEYFTPQLSKDHNQSPRSGRNQKKNQDSVNKIRPNTTNNKNKKSKPNGNSYTLKNLKKVLNSSKTEKLTLLAKIRLLLRRLEN